MIDILGPLIGVAFAAAFALDLWCEPLLFDTFGTSGATGFWENGAQTRCTFVETAPVRIAGECSLA